MKQVYDEIVIDGNSIGYAAHSARVLPNKTHGEVQAIFFGLKMIKKAIDNFATPGHTRVSVLWDDKAQWRFDILPEYKGKRDDDPVKKASRSQYKRQVPVLRKALSMLGVTQLFARGDEADDLGSALVHNRKPGTKILLVTGDHDWLQLVCNDVDWFDPREEGKFCDIGTFESFTGLKNPVAFSQAKAMLGDSSDNVQGVAGIGDKAVAAIFAQWGSVAKMFQWADSVIETGEFMRGDLPDSLSRHRTAMTNFVFGPGKERFLRNMKLMNLISKRHRSDEIITKQVVCKTPFDEAGFENLCHEYAFMSIITSMPKWKATFA